MKNDWTRRERRLNARDLADRTTCEAVVRGAHGDAGQVRAVGRPDVLMIPVGGHYTVGPGEADQVIEAISPRLVIPIHYKTEVNEGWTIGHLEEFTRGKRGVRREGNTVTVVYSGPYRSISDLEAATAASGTTSAVVSHALLVLQLKPLKDRDIQRLQAELATLPSVRRSALKGSTLELIADLDALRPPDLMKAFELSHFDFSIASHECPAQHFSAVSATHSGLAHTESTV